MEKNNNNSNPNSPLKKHKERGEDKNNRTQKQRVFEYLKDHIVKKTGYKAWHNWHF